jgi:hypothetical protein
MTALMKQIEDQERRRRRVRGFVVLAVAAGIGVWLTVPYGIVLVASGAPLGWLLVVGGGVLLAGCVAAIVAAVRLHRAVAPQSLPGKANPSFDEPVPSQDPVPGYSWAGSFIGSP